MPEENTPPECPLSPNGEHWFTPDIEYDETGLTINCEFCGEPDPEENA